MTTTEKEEKKANRKLRALYYKITPKWRLIRVLGELRLLTKVSYISLVIVPIVALCWDGIQLTKNKFNSIKDKEIENLITISEKELTSFRNRITEYRTEDLKNLRSANVCLNEAEVLLNKLDFANRERKNSPLNKVWIRVFLCAIFVGLGHLVYQIWSPAEVQKHSLESYVNEKKSLFSDFGTSSELNKAEAIIKSDKGRLLLEDDERRIRRKITSLGRMAEARREKILNQMSFPKLYEAKEFLVEKEQESGSITEAERKIFDAINLKFENVGTDDRKLINLDIIAKAAEVDYKKTSVKHPLSIILSGIFYGLGIWLLLLIIHSQVKFVMEAGGLEFFDYFMP